MDPTAPRRRTPAVGSVAPRPPQRRHGSGPAGVATAVAPAEPGIGDLVGGRYRIDAQLGYGGMAHVYRAHDERLRRDVAIKVFRAGVSEAVDPKRTTREMHILASLSHPAVVSVLDASDDPVNGAYIVMELVEGDDLGTALRDGALPAEQARRIAGDVAAALAALHGRSIVHRDVKPANILVLSAAAAAAGGVAAKLTDFGIAQLIDGTRITAPEQIIGTAAYLSPEQVRGERVGPASDVYALGLVLLECLTGQRAFPGSGAETAMARLTRPPAVPDTASAGLADLLRRMTAVDPAARPGADEVAALLRERLVGQMLAGEDTRTAQTPALPMAALAAASLPLATGPVRTTGGVPVTAARTGPAATGGVRTGTGGFFAPPFEDADAERVEARRRRRLIGMLSGLLGGFAALIATAAVVLALTAGPDRTAAPVEQRSGSAPAASAPATPKAPAPTSRGAGSSASAATTSSTVRSSSAAASPSASGTASSTRSSGGPPSSSAGSTSRTAAPTGAASNPPPSGSTASSSATSNPPSSGSSSSGSSSSGSSSSGSSSSGSSSSGSSSSGSSSSSAPPPSSSSTGSSSGASGGAGLPGLSGGNG